MYEVELSEDRGVPIFTITGRLDVDADRAIDAAIRAECERRRRDLALVDIRGVTQHLSTFDNHEAAKTFRQRLGGFVRAVAIVDREAFRSNSEMFQLTAGNRGANVRFFGAREPAMDWLLKLGCPAAGTGAA